MYERSAESGSRFMPPGQIIRIVTKRWWLLFVCALVGASLGLGVASQMTRTYTATGSLVVDSKSFAIPELQGAISGEASPDPLPAVRTAAIDLRSPSLLQAVVDELHLTASPYFNADLREPGILAPVVNWVHSVVARLFPSAPKRPEDTPAFAALELEKRLTIFYDNTSLAVKASVVLPDAQLATTIVNTIMARYIDGRGDSRAQANAAANAALQQTLGRVRSEVDALDAQARDLRAKNKLTVLPAGSLGQQRLSELGTEQAHATADRQQLEAKLARAAQLTRRGNVADFADVISSQTISRLREQEVLAAQRLARISSTTTPNSGLRRVAESEYQQVEDKIKAEMGRVVTSLGAQTAAVHDRENAATQALGVASEAAAKAGLIQSDIVQVENEAKSRRKLYQSLLERASQTSLSPAVAKASPGVYIGSSAVVPVVPSGPHTSIVVGLGMLAGLMFGCVFSLKRGVNAPFLANPGEIASYAQLPLLGVLPIWTRSQHLRLPGAARSMARTEQDEALGLLYVRLRHQAAQNGKELRSVLFASEDTEESSVLARNFVDLAAREGERVLLIDTRSVIEEPAAAPSRRGDLKSVLEGHQAWRNVVVQDPDFQTNFLPSSNGSLEGLDTKSATRLRSMLHEAVEDYTLVVIVSSCAIRSVQTSHLIKASDFTLLIVNSQRARPAAVSAAVDYLTSIKSDLGLAVLSRDSIGRSSIGRR